MPADTGMDWLGYDATIVWAMTNDTKFMLKADRPNGSLFEILLADWFISADGSRKAFRSADLAQSALLYALRRGDVFARGIIASGARHEPADIPFSEWDSLHFLTKEDGSTVACGLSLEGLRYVDRWHDLQFRTADIFLHLRLPAFPARPLQLRSQAEQETEQATFIRKVEEALKEEAIEPADNSSDVDDGADLLAERDWSLPMALAWAVTGALHAVRDHWHEDDGGQRASPSSREDVALAVQYDESVSGLVPVRSADEAWNALVSHLRNGRLVARRRDGSEVSANFWRGLGGTETPDVLISRADLFVLWPASGRAMDTQGPTFSVSPTYPASTSFQISPSIHYASTWGEGSTAGGTSIVLRSLKTEMSGALVGAPSSRAEENAEQVTGETEALSLPGKFSPASANAAFDRFVEEWREQGSRQQDRPTRNDLVKKLQADVNGINVTQARKLWGDRAPEEWRRKGPRGPRNSAKK